MRRLARLLITLTLVMVAGILSWFVWTNGSVAGSINPDSPGVQNKVPFRKRVGTDSNI